MDSILVTDEQFVFDEHIAIFEAAGYKVVRLEELKASEEQLIKALEGKVGYILGGIEHVTAPVIERARDLRAIAFTGSGYRDYIPAWHEATQRGIAISAAVGGNAPSVAEFTLALLFAMVRNVHVLMATAPAPEYTHEPRELSALTLGIVGYGRIGHELAARARALGMRVIQNGGESDANATAVPLPALLETADVVSLHASQSRTECVLGADELGLMKPGAILINTAFPTAVDEGALLQALGAGRIRAALDGAPSKEFDGTGLPAGSLLMIPIQAGYNTREANRRISDRVTRSLLNLLRDGQDDDLVNPEFRQVRAR